MAALQIRLAVVFQSATAPLARDQRAFGPVDTFNHDHGDPMGERFEFVPQVMKARKGASAADRRAQGNTPTPLPLRV